MGRGGTGGREFFFWFRLVSFGGFGFLGGEVRRGAGTTDD